MPSRLKLLAPVLISALLGCEEDLAEPIRPSAAYVAVAAQQQPMSGIAVRALDPSGEQLEDITASNGVVVFVPIGPGEWEFEIDVPDGYLIVPGTPNPQTVNVRGGQPVFVYFNLIPS